jgi:phage I-like protein
MGNRPKPPFAALALADLMPEAVEGQPRVPPKEFRIFKFGVNTSTKGSFLFDELAAELVMAAFTAHAVDLNIDYDHAILQAGKGGAKSPAAGFCSLEVRAGELWAIRCDWSDDGKADLEAGRYRYFSPLFAFDEASGRVTRLINCALTNVPALDGIDALVAASATHEGDQHMEEQLKQARERIATLERENTAKDGKIEALSAEVGSLKTEVGTLKPSATTIAALSGTIGLAVTAPPADVQTAVAALSADRRKLLEVTGKDSVAAALGAIEGWKSEAADAGKLKAQLETDRIAALSTELGQLLDKASVDGKIPKADRAEWEKGALAFGAGKPSKDGIAWLSARIEAMTPLNSDGSRHKQPEEKVAALSELELEIARKTNSDPKKLAEFKAKKAAAGARA